MKNKIWLIIQREYWTRVQKKSFIVMTILAPILFAALMMSPFLLMNMDKSSSNVAVIDESTIFADHLENNKEVVFTKLDNLDSATSALKADVYDIVLYITPADSGKLSSAYLYYNEKQPGLGTHSAIEKQVQAILRNKLLLETHQITSEEYEKIAAVKIDIQAQNIMTGEESSTGLKTAIGYVSAFLIYLFVFLFGAQVMQGVIEEKSNRIVEVIVSSVKPFQIMMGKITGIAFVGLTQFLLWVLLTAGLVTLGSSLLMSGTDTQAVAASMDMGGMVNTEKLANENMAEVASILNGIQALNIPLIVGMFLLYFVGGYLLYSALFAAVGSAVDNEADTQQFIMPITVPLILALIAMSMVMRNPNGDVAFWMSMIPFTSPIIMMMRVPFGVPTWELGLSLGLLVIGFVLTTWFAAKIYRVGILMYGKKITYGELWKWLKY